MTEITLISRAVLLCPNLMPEVYTLGKLLRHYPVERGKKKVKKSRKGRRKIVILKVKAIA